ncbi:hypothetical protein [Microbulbifer spongiae]|uniref:DNA gyrase subunit B n=1 Tax=Microbulbifer spongiae TaxID=2944933 RepID=A0ABY9EB78_9GAMM|nr:hypothetical protein [Microbulbifer sp. MI-G]WKD49932.1 hypothetical protein M8T91_00435 [Microbulbifer sp. MI-G]
MKLLFSVILILYPLTVYFGLQYLSLNSILMLLLLITIMRLVYSDDNGKKIGGMVTLSLSLVLVLSWLRDDPNGLLWYPVLCNIILFWLFAYSLKQPKSIIERIARIKEPDMPYNGVVYTRKVTKIWCIFFLVNGSFATATVINGNMQVWVLYNGLISYILMGLLIASEWLVRRRIHNEV